MDDHRLKRDPGYRCIYSSKQRRVHPSSTTSTYPRQPFYNPSKSSRMGYANMMNSDCFPQEYFDKEFIRIYGYDMSTIDPYNEDFGVNLLEDKEPVTVDVDYSSLNFDKLDISLPITVGKLEKESEVSSRNISDHTSVGDTETEHSETPQRRLTRSSKKGAKPKKRRQRAKRQPGKVTLR